MIGWLVRFIVLVVLLLIDGATTVTSGRSHLEHRDRVLPQTVPTQYGVSFTPLIDIWRTAEWQRTRQPFGLVAGDIGEHAAARRSAEKVRPRNTSHGSSWGHESQAEVQLSHSSYLGAQQPGQAAMVPKPHTSRRWPAGNRASRQTGFCNSL